MVNKQTKVDMIGNKDNSLYRNLLHSPGFYSWLIFIVSLAVRLLHIAFLKEGFYFSDFKWYENAALSLLNGDGFGAEYERPPIYPLFLAGNFALFEAYILPVRIVQALLGAYSSVLIFRISEEIFGGKAAKITAWISVFYPYYIFIVGLLYPTQLTVFLLICTVYFLILSVRRKSVLYLAGSSLCLALASLAVPASLAFMPFLIIWFLFFSGTRKDVAAIRILLYTAVLGLCLSPWIHYCYKKYGRLILIDPRAENHLPMIQADENENGSELVKQSDRIGLIIANPGKFIGNFSKEFLHFWKFTPTRVMSRNMHYREKIYNKDRRMVLDNPYTSSLMDWVSIITYGPVFIFALVGVIFCFRSWSLCSLPLLLLLSHAIVYSFFFTQTRYRLPVEFCLMILAGGGLAGLLAWIREWRRKV